ncbi:O-antigen ligase family protein [Candidatus Parcubacteria bacterium]|nr:O-antigen ligase family protein [Candidatus Parcubacteria bacterium]
MILIETGSGVLLLALVFVGFAVLSWWRFAAAAAAALALIPLWHIRFPVGPVPVSVPELMSLVLFARALPFFVQRSTWTFVWRELRALALPSALLTLGLVAGILRSGAYRTGLGILKSWFLVPLLLGFVLWLTMERGAVKKVHVLAGLIGGGVLAAVGAIGYIVSGDLAYDSRLTAWYGSPNFLAMYLAPLVVLAFAASRAAIAREWQTVSRWAGAVMVLPLLLTRSLGAIGASLAVGAGVLWFSRKATAGKRLIAVGLAALVAAGFFYAVFQPPFASRRVIWQVAFEIGFDHAFSGIGPGVFQAAYLQNQPKHPPYPEWAVPHPHSLLLTTWLSAGIMGLAGFVGLILVLWRRFRQTKNAPFAGAVALALMVPVLHGLVDTTLWRADLATVWWVLVVLLVAAP